MNMTVCERRMSRVVMMLVVFLTAVLVAGASVNGELMNQADDAEPARHDVFGETVTSDGSALPGVLIGLSVDGVDQKTVSSDDGTFRFSSVPPGSYSIIFKTKGMKKVKREITVSNGDLDLGKITME